MKRFVSIVILALCLSFNAGAQNFWWLFPGSKQRAREEQKQKQQQAEQQAAEAVAIEEAAGEAEAPADSLYAAEAEEGIFVFEAYDRMRITMMLPLHSASGQPNSNFLEMYSGALLALRDLGRDGMAIDFEILDSSVPGFRPEEHIFGRDVVIGPVEYDALEQLLPYCSLRQFIVSPLEPKAAELCTQGRLVQSPVPWTTQVEELVEWLRTDYNFTDEIIVIKDSSAKGMGEQSGYMMTLLDRSGLRYRSVSSFKEVTPAKEVKYRVLIASDDDAFITRSVKELGIAANMRDNIILYTTSRVRNCVGPNVTDLYNTQTRLTAAYFIDYSSHEVEDFILAYRSLFRAEPGSFAFQGYDLVKYYASACKSYGRRWAQKLGDFPSKGLQSDFEFDRYKDAGRVNHAVRKVIYNRDLSTTLVH